MNTTDIRVTRTTTGAQGVTRSHYPYLISCRCPGCGHRIGNDLSGRCYLSQPTYGESEKHVLYCDKCATEVVFRLIVEVSLVVLGPVEVSDGS